MIRPGETLEELRAAMAAHASADGLDRLPAVHALAEKAHRGQLRKSRAPFITHAIAVATLVASWGQPSDVVFAALLHDVPDVWSDLSALRDLVGDDTVEVVLATRVGTSAANWAGAQGVVSLAGVLRKAAVVKLADRVHNSRTWEFIARPAMRRKAAENVAVAVPIARRLGLPGAAAELAARSDAALAGAPRLVRSATALLPERDRTRYALEWSADVAHTPPGPARRRLVAGIIWSALRMRLDAVL